MRSAGEDHSRLAHSEARGDETAAMAVRFWTRAVTFFADPGLPVREVISYYGPCYLSRTLAAANVDSGVTVMRTRRFRPQTKGRVERLQRTMHEEWGYANPYASESVRPKA